MSGVVVAPKGAAPKDGRPVVTWAHGTRGIADVCAPSRRRAVASEIPGITEMLAKGFTVVASDYEGLGTPGVHPYLVGDSEAHGVLDIARAAQHVKGAGASDNVIVSGHSQGGQAAIFAGEIAPVYAPDLKVAGIAAAAPATELDTMLPVASTLPDTLGFVVMGIVGFHAAYPDAQPASIFSSATVGDLGYVDKKCADDVMEHFATSPGDVIKQSPADVAPFPTLMAQNTPGTVTIQSPVFVAQGDKDRTIYKAFTDTFVQRACAHGDQIEYRTYDGTDHYTVRDASRTDLMTWMSDRFAGRPATSTCSAL